MTITTQSDSVVDNIEQEYLRRTRRSAELFQAASTWIPGGASRSLVVHKPYPIVMDEGTGTRFTDVDGHEYSDFVNCHSALVHGHAHPGITAAIQRQAERGTAWSSASQEEVDLARMICERVPSVEQVRFCSSGTEAGMYVVRMARLLSGRDKTLKFEGAYHGSYDDLDVSKVFRVEEAGPADDPQPTTGTLGFPRGMTDRVLIAPFNNKEVTARRIEEYKNELAAVIVEPVLGAGGMIPPENGFLLFLREITRDFGILLIADEVVTFRLAYGSAQQLYGIEPDLTMFGKVIGGGLPQGAIGGRKDLMQSSTYDVDGSTPSKLSLSGTFSGAALEMAAGRASLEALDEAAIQHINKLGELMRQLLRETLLETGITAQVTGVGSLLQVHYTDQPVREYRAAATSNRAILGAMHLWLLNNGVAAYPRGALNISTPMTEGDVRLAVEVLGEGLSQLRPFIHSVAPHLVAN